MGSMLNRQEAATTTRPSHQDRDAGRVPATHPEMRAEVKRLLKQLLAECAAAAVVSQTDE
jgi:hypothetical protein